MKTLNSCSPAQRVLDAYHLSPKNYSASARLANVCRVLAAIFLPLEDIDALPSYRRVAARQRDLTRAQLLAVARDLDGVDEMVYAEQVVTGEPNE